MRIIPYRLKQLYKHCLNMEKFITVLTYLKQTDSFKTNEKS